MRTYKAKTLVKGFKLGKSFAGKTVVGVSKYNGEPLVVEYQNQRMLVSGEPLTRQSFPDKFGRGEYSLAYFEWKPEEWKLDNTEWKIEDKEWVLPELDWDISKTEWA